MLPLARPLAKFDETKHPRDQGRFAAAAGYAGSAASGLGAAAVLRGIAKPAELGGQFAPAIAAAGAGLASHHVARELARGAGVHLRAAWPVYAAGAAAGLLFHHLSRGQKPGSKRYVFGETAKHVLNMANHASLGAVGGQLLGVPLAAVLRPRVARAATGGLMAAGAAWHARRDIQAIAALHQGRSDPAAAGA